MKHLNAMVLMSALLMVALSPDKSNAHCQIPCGIYSDNVRVVMMLEDVETLAKSVAMLNELAPKNDVQSKAQFARWVTNKEQHAEKIISTIANYYLTQRVKPAQDDYVERLKAHHAIIINAMKVKQNTEMKYVNTLKDSVQALLRYYPAEHKH
ncbi:MAG: superoxide dismutase [Ni] [Kiritimatiellia bacterium]